MLKTGVISNKSWLPDAHAVRTAQTLCELADTLARFRSLRPDAEVDDVFGRLVGTVLGTPFDVGRDILSHPGVRARADQIRRLCSRGERELEHAWSERIDASATPHAELNRFPYVDNYRRLVRLEAGILTAYLAESARPAVAFIGCGPLPLSALFLASELGTAVVGFDRDIRAVAAARRLARLIGSHDVRFHRADAVDLDLAGYQVVVLAALVGETPAEKTAILTRIRATMTPRTIVLARSARGLRTLLYPPLDEAGLTGFEVLGAVHPVNDIVNSVVVARPVENAAGG